MNGEEPGLLGKLPRSRPGKRSEKREGPAATGPEPASGASPTGEPAADAGGDPVGNALRSAARTAEAGLRTANDVTREILRRLPRP